MLTTIIFDGQCALCTQSVRLIRRLDWRHRLAYLDAQYPDNVRARFPDLRTDLDPNAMLGEIHVVAGGQVFVGYAGMRRISRELPLLMWLYPLLFLPGIRGLGARVYRWVAAHRYTFNRLWGGPVECTGTCQIHHGA